MDRGRAHRQSGEPQAVDAVRIEALGGLRVSVGDRALELSNQPFRCALLLYLVIERKTTRKQLIELLWPTKDPSRARRSLSQTLYELKRELGAPLVESASEVIEVSENVEVDVAEFLAAVDSDDVAEALAYYDGPFLGGLHLSTTVPFEHWAEKLRGVLERHYSRLCLERLNQLEAAEDWDEAVTVARAWTERDHLKDEAWHHLIQALWMTGRSREALASYEWFKAALSRELEVSPIDDTKNLVERIRKHIEPRPSVGPPPDDSERPARVVGGVTAGTGRPRWFTWPVGLAGVLVAAVVGWFAIQAGPAEAVPAHARVIAVAPMQVVGDVPEELSTGIPSLVAAVLDQLDDIRTLGPMRYASVAAEAGLDTDPDGVAQAGRLLNANSALVGTLTSAGDEVRAEVVLRSAETGGSLAYASATAHVDSASQLVDSLALGLLRDLWRADDELPSLRVSAISSSHPQALRHYIRGEQHFLHSRWDSAQSEFRLATLADPEFALAHFRYGESITWGQAFGMRPRRDLVRAAYQHRNRLPERERRLVEIARLDLEGDVHAGDSVNSFLEDYPDDPDGWFELGDVRVHAWKLIPYDRQQLLEPFDRAASMEPKFSRVYIHPLQVTATLGDRTLFEDYLRRFEASTGTTETGFEGWSEAIWGDELQARDGLRRALASTTPNSPSPLVQGFLDHGTADPSLVVDALESAVAEEPRPRRREQLTRLHADALMALGRIEEASAVLAPLFDSDPIGVASAAVSMRAATGVASPLEARAEAYLRDNQQDPIAVIWLSWLEASKGEFDAVRNRLTELNSASDEQLGGLVSGTLGWLDAEAGDLDAGLERMDQGLRTAGYAHSASPLIWAYERLAAEHPDRERALRHLTDARSDLAYIVPRLLVKARLLGSSPAELRMKETIEACVSRLWANADLELAAGGRRPR